LKARFVKNTVNQT